MKNTALKVLSLRIFSLLSKIRISIPEVAREFMDCSVVVIQ